MDGSRVRKEKKCGFKNIRIRVDGTSLICFLSGSLRTFPATFVLCLHTQRPVPSSRPRKGTDHSQCVPNLKGFTVVMIAAIVVIAGDKVEQSSLLPVSI